ncbi:MFS general substrate transporter [Meredithblackwellia eburnea MCA 4105]
MENVIQRYQEMTPTIELVAYPSRIPCESASISDERELVKQQPTPRSARSASPSISPTRSRANSLQKIAPDSGADDLLASSLPPVDRGKGAWGFALAAFALETFIWGYSFTFGIVQVYLNNHPPFNTASIAEVSSVGTVALAIQYITPVGVIMIFKRYPDKARSILWAAMLVSCGSMLISSWATKVWHLILLQGVLGGASGAILYAPVLLWLQEWFVEKRGTASGIIFSGTGIGGFVFPFFIENLLERVGFPWTVRIWSLTTFVLFGVSLFYLKPRVPPVKPTRGEGRGQFLPVDLSFLFSPIVILMCLTTFVSSISFFPVSLYIPTYVTSLASPLSATVVLAVFNAAGVVGQIAIGWFSDKYPYPNIIMFIGVGSAIAAFFSWGYADTLGKVFGFAILFGSISNICSVWGSVAREVSGTNSQTSSFVFCAFGIHRGIASLVGPIIASTLYNKHEAEKLGTWGRFGFRAVTIFVGVMALVSAFGGVALAGARRIQAKRHT